MRDRPDGLDEEQVRRALGAWGIEAASPPYQPVGFGDYHWTAAEATGRRWFVTVADLERKTLWGGGPEATRRRLRQAMDTAVALTRDPELDFVVAPVPTTRGETVRALGPRYALSVFPLVDGFPGRFGQTFGAQERGEVIELLAKLHQRTPPEVTPVAPLELPLRAHLEDALAQHDRPWPAGPFAEPARTLVREHATGLRRRLEEFDRRVEETRRRRPRLVVTPRRAAPWQPAADR
jgi:spectinomycin phosphotransferase